MGRRPLDKESIDRIDNNGNYSKENCKWATRVEQNNNKRNNKYVTYRGQTKTITSWARELGFSKSTYYRNLKAGMSPEEIIYKFKLRSGGGVE